MRFLKVKPVIVLSLIIVVVWPNGSEIKSYLLFLAPVSFLRNTLVLSRERYIWFEITWTNLLSIDIKLSPAKEAECWFGLVKESLIISISGLTLCTLWYPSRLPTQPWWLIYHLWGYYQFVSYTLWPWFLWVLGFLPWKYCPRFQKGLVFYSIS